ncbi:MAG: proteasome subunit alpha [Propionibacteriaceae bacterium]|jgi:proteasome alpha subunit|nr:proteasome subunit alpha [Propionibacteriaceae bacterium]
MSQPVFYVSPEQQVKDRAEFARSGIAKGRSVIVARYGDGILFVGENRSKSLHKIAEIYDRIGFAAVGRYNEFENLRVAGIRHADVRGYAYDRRDVTGRMLAGAYAQLLGTIFSAVMEKPYEVEMVLAEVGATAESDEIYRLSFDGSITDESQFAVIGGAADAVGQVLRQSFDASMELGAVLRLAIQALIADPRGGNELTANALEVAVLDRTRASARKFRRLSVDEITALTTPAPKASPAAAAPRRRRKATATSGASGEVPTTDAAASAGSGKAATTDAATTSVESGSTTISRKSRATGSAARRAESSAAPAPAEAEAVGETVAPKRRRAPRKTPDAQ